MSEYLVLECSRQSGRKSYTQIEEDQDVYKNKWVNNVSTSGIEIKRGDIISLEQSAINTAGTIQNSIELLGDDKENNIKDNKFAMEMETYITHSGYNTIPLPMRRTQTYCSAVANNFTLLKNARNRGLGEIVNSESPISNMNNYVESVITGGAGFEENGFYTSASDFTGHPLVQDLVFKAVKVESGELVLAELVSIVYATTTKLGFTNLDVYIGLSQDPTANPNPTTASNVRVNLCDKSLMTKNYIQPNNRRYYPARGDFTGVAFLSATGSPSWTDNLNASFRPRYKTINVEIEAGLKTPQTISTEITDQIQNPVNQQLLSQPRDYVNTGSKLTFESQSTSVWGVNYDTSTTPYTGTTDDEILKRLYSQIAHENPQKIEGLQFSRQFYYAGNNNNTLNQINTGNNQLASSGDYHTQSVGDHGLNMAMTNYFPNTGGLISMSEGDIITTNVYFTEDNIIRIANGFRKAEVNCGLYTNTTTSNTDLGVPLDCGLYTDQVSQATLGFPLASGSRFRFATGRECVITPTLPQIYITTDGALGNNKGTKYPYFEGDSSDNDGQELSQVVVKSRYADVGTTELDTCLTKLKAPLGITDFKVDAGKTRDDVFFGQGYEDLIALSKKYDVACIPVFPDVSSGEWYKHSGRPYIAFISKLSTTTTSTDTYNQDTQTGWKIDSINFGPSLQLGLDTSFIRNKGVVMVNNQFNDRDVGIPEGLIVGGAYNLQFNFDTNTSRFFMSDMNTNIKDGNGQPYQDPQVLEYLGIVSETPEQQVYGLNTKKSCFSYMNDNNASYKFDFEMETEAFKIMDTLTGVSLRTLYLYDTSDNVKITQNYFDDTLQSLDNSLLDKMGFEMNQLFNLKGNVQARYNPTTSSSAQTIRQQVYNNPRPLTQNSIVGVAELNSSQLNGTIPLFLTGVNDGVSEARPQTTQNKILASNLPSALDYPYLVVYSSIIREGTLSKYIGGNNSQQLLNAMGYITRYNNEGSFFYGAESSFQYTATKDFVLSEITTEIKLPDGSIPRLDKNSSVIYKIIKPLPLLPAFIPPNKTNFDINDIYIQ